MSTTPLPRKPAPISNPWLKKLNALLALVALANLGLVLFDASYIRFRDLYFRYLPQLTQRYDWVKGIEPFRDTEQYLTVADQLEMAIAQKGLKSPQVSQALADLRDRSVSMVQEDPFRIANKSGNLERLKNRMRQHMKTKSSRDAFRAFWSLQHLNEQNWRAELAFFDRNFRPIIAANYFRPIDESGDFVNRFWILDIGFVGLFAADLLVRVIWIRRRHRTSWKDALLWRWYDLLLLLPFWRFARAIPVSIRLHQAGLIDLHNIQEQVNRNIAENIAAEVAELVLIQSFNAVQGSVKQGLLRQSLEASTSIVNPLMVDANQIDELSAISHRLVEVVRAVLPKVQPDVEVLVRHTIQQAIAQSPFYQTVRVLPGFERLADEIAKQVTHQALQTVSGTLASAVSDEISPKLIRQLGQHFLVQVQAELDRKQTLTEIETLLVAWIEDLKLTVLQNFDAQTQPQVLREAERTRWLREPSPVEVLPQQRKP
ncbi:hypothetical protein [Altericista sp. CCNU0014]|uniref:hypothetical protein n=1 Tax=Altericista sp. CCNU0014 TaxID=3082949 RepID=UPI0038508559